MKTWHYEHAVIVAVLVAVWLSTGHQYRDLLGSVAVYLGHCCASIGARMEERQTGPMPAVTCVRWFWRYYVAKEITWFAYFVWAQTWSALVGCVLFAIYPVWRKAYRKYIKPLEPA
jgi:hypothetical protein